jgi:hypothetical protein
MRGLVRQELLNIPELLTIVPEDRIYGSGAVGIPRQQEHDVPPRPFAEIRFSILTPGLSLVKRRRVEIWFHDDEGSYDRIDRCIKLVYGHLDQLAQVNFSDPETGENSELILAEWISDSTDLYDTGYRTNCRSTGYDLVGKEL